MRSAALATAYSAARTTATLARTARIAHVASTYSMMRRSGPNELRRCGRLLPGFRNLVHRIERKIHGVRTVVLLECVQIAEEPHVVRRGGLADDEPRIA